MIGTWSFAFSAEPQLISVKHGTHTMTAADSSRPSLSADGRIVAFESMARLTIDDRNKLKDIYVFDRETKTLRRIVTKEPQRKNGGPSVSGDGRVVAFHSYAPVDLKKDIPLRAEVGVYARETGEVNWPLAGVLDSVIDGESLFPRANRTGERLVFTSNSMKLGAPEGFTQIYSHEAGETKCVLLSRNAAWAPANRQSGHPRVSDDGRQVAFLSAATNLTPALPAENNTFHLYWLDRSAGTIDRIDLFERGFNATELIAGAFDMDAAGNILVFEARHRDLDEPYKTLELSDIYLYDRDKDCVTLLTTGIFANKSDCPSLSADGQYMAFIHNGNVVVHDLFKDRWQQVAGGYCDSVVISRDGRFVAFDRKDKKSRNVYVVPNSLIEGP